MYLTQYFKNIISRCNQHSLGNIFHFYANLQNAVCNLYMQHISTQTSHIWLVAGILAQI